MGCLAAPLGPFDTKLLRKMGKTRIEQETISRTARSGLVADPPRWTGNVSCDTSKSPSVSREKSFPTSLNLLQTVGTC